tara:strand:+ start:855 stop:2270 length:1416 start_codon:yes stop_codon:yes gene_type:complete
MPRPDGGLITETNRQYYAGAQQFYLATGGNNLTFTSTFDTNLIFGSSDPSNGQYGLNNFTVSTSANAQTWAELTPAASVVNAVINQNGGVASVNITTTVTVASLRVGMTIYGAGITGNPTAAKITVVNGINITLDKAIALAGAATTPVTFQFDAPFTMSGNIITIADTIPNATYVKIQLKDTAVQENRGSYEYTKLHDVIDNFLIAFVGAGKIIPSVKRTDVIFHAKRGLQEFSYDTLKSIRSQELTIPPSLSLIIPQDYVNYVRFSWIDQRGVQHTIYPANTLTTNPYSNPVQDNFGTPTQDNFDSNLTGTSQTEAAWEGNDPRNISGAFVETFSQDGIFGRSFYDGSYGQRYGMNPETSQRNGWFTINERNGTFDFTSELSNKLIVIEYVSDGNAYDLDAKIPKLAEDALYSHIAHGILASTAQTPEYLVQRFKRERSAKLRNAKIRLSNIKLDQIIQVMRNQSKWIKY